MVFILVGFASRILVWYRVGSVNANVQPLPVPRTTPTSFTQLAHPITLQPQQLWMKQLKLWKGEEKEKRLEMWQLRKGLGLMSQLSEEDTKANAVRVWRLHKSKKISAHNKRRSLLSVTTQARQEIRIWRGLTQRHMGVRGRTVT
jgi:hypothetical protein